ILCRIDFFVRAVNAYAQHLHQYALPVWNVRHFGHRYRFQMHRIRFAGIDCYCFHREPSFLCFFVLISSYWTAINSIAVHQAGTGHTAALHPETEKDAATLMPPLQTAPPRRAYMSQEILSAYMPIRYRSITTSDRSRSAKA